MHLPSAGHAHRRRLFHTSGLAAALTCMAIASPAAAQSEGTSLNTTVATPPDSAPSGAAPAKDAVLTEEAKWLQTKLPKLTATKVLLEVSANIGGTDVMQARTRVVRAKLDRCTLTLERLFEADGIDDLTGGRRVRHIVPLEGADPLSLTVRQRQPEASSLAMISGQPWRVVLTLRDGSIRTDVDLFGRRATSNDGDLDLIVPSQAAGLEIATHLHAAILACQ